VNRQVLLRVAYYLSKRVKAVFESFRGTVWQFNEKVKMKDFVETDCMQTLKESILNCGM
jgi:hypothetical protein